MSFKFIVALAIVIGLVGLSIALVYSNGGSSGSAKNDSSGHAATSNLQTKFGILSQATSDVCTSGYAQSAAFLNSQSSSANLQGSCCYPMVYSHYVQQINGLEAYSNISVILPDPYNVSVSLVKQMFAYASTPLDRAQNATFTQTLQLSKEGLCCCQCWAWYFHEGLIKHLIISKYNLSPSSLSNLLDLEDCCGGS